MWELPECITSCETEANNKFVLCGGNAQKRHSCSWQCILTTRVVYHPMQQYQDIKFKTRKPKPNPLNLFSGKQSPSPDI